MTEGTTYRIGTWEVAPGAVFFQMRGGRIRECELVEPYEGTSLWIAKECATGKTFLTSLAYR